MKARTHQTASWQNTADCSQLHGHLPTWFIARHKLKRNLQTVRARCWTRGLQQVVRHRRPLPKVAPDSPGQPPNSNRRAACRNVLLIVGNETHNSLMFNRHHEWRISHGGADLLDRDGFGSWEAVASTWHLTSNFKSCHSCGHPLEEDISNRHVVQTEKFRQSERTQVDNSCCTHGCCQKFDSRLFTDNEETPA